MKMALHLAASLLVAMGVLVAPEARAGGPQRPNIVFILSDDQRFDLLSQMPNVKSLVMDHGVTFSNSFVTDPLCCPSRATILRGQYSHTTGIYQVGGPYGGWKQVNKRHLENDTIATWLKSVGYTTAFFGKYLNGYGKADYVPPGWDSWNAFVNEGNMYYNYIESRDGVPVSYGSSPEDYSTDVLSAQVDAYIRSADPNTPLFVSFDPRAPHFPTIAAPRYVGTTCPLKPPKLNASDWEADVSDKPAYVQSYAVPTSPQATGLWKKQCLALRATDDAVGVIIQALQDTGRSSNTMIVYASDNGLTNTEHRLQGKKSPYESSIRVPLTIRYDAAGTHGTIDTHIVANVDYAETFLELAGATATIHEEGLSLMPLIRGDVGVPWRSALLIEGYDDPADPQGGFYVPTYCALRTANAIYVQYVTGEREYYNLRVDPLELVNRADDPAAAGQVQALHARLVPLCQPAPPGMAVT